MNIIGTFAFSVIKDLFAYLPGGECFWVGTNSQCFGVGADSIQSSRGMKSHRTHRLCVLQLVHPHKLGFGLF